MLHDVRIAKALRKQDMEHRNVSWILDQDGEEEHWIEMIRETRGQNFVVDCELTIKVLTTVATLRNVSDFKFFSLTVKI